MANLMRWDPFGDPYSIKDAFSRIFGGGQPWLPTTDIIDRQSELVLRADLPGVEQKDIEVTVDEDSVVIRGMANADTDEQDQNYYRRERAFGTFTRVIPLSVPIKTEEARATFKNGLLEVVLPKADQARPRARRLEIH
ncbi:MAG: Hsp20/alpha crystallin family protein [Bacteroidota bacterium]